MFWDALYAQIPRVLLIINCPQLGVSSTTSGVIQ